MREVSAKHNRRASGRRWRTPELPLHYIVMRTVSILCAVVLLTAAFRCAAGSPQSVSQASSPARSSIADSAEISSLEHELAERPLWTEGWWKLGVLDYEGNRYTEAVRALNTVLVAKPDLSAAWALLGLCEFESRDFVSARQHLERAQSTTTGVDAEVAHVASYHLALLVIHDGAFEQALTLLDSAFPAQERPAQIALARGLAFLRVPLLPESVDPSSEALLTAAGTIPSGASGSSGFAAFTRLHPRTPFAHYAYASALQAGGRLREALAELHAETEVTPDSPVVFTAIAGVEARFGEVRQAHAAEAQAALHQQNAEAALRSTGTLYMRQELPAMAPTELWEEAMQAYSAKDYRHSADLLRRYLSGDRENGTGWAVLGLDEYELGDSDSALLHLERGSALGLRGSAGQLERARSVTGLLLLRAGRFETANSILVEARKEDASSEDLRIELGLALLRQGDLPKDEAQRALAGQLGDIGILLASSRYDEAFARLKPVIREHPRTPFLHYVYGLALLSLSEFHEAAAEMLAEIAVSPKSDLPYLRLASIALRDHRPADAIAPATTAIALMPSSAEGHYLLGRARLETDDATAAVTELEKARAMNPGSPEIHFNLARAYARVQRPQDALSERAEFTRLHQLEEERTTASGSYTEPPSSAELSAKPGTRTGSTTPRP